MFEEAIELLDSLIADYGNRDMDDSVADKVRNLEGLKEQMKQKLSLDRFYPIYYRVGFYGQGFGASLRAKSFIYKENPHFDRAQFLEKLKVIYPRAEVLTYTAPPTPEVVNGQGQYIQIFLVKPSSPAEMSGNPPPSVKAFPHRNVHVFSYSRPFRKNKDKEVKNEFEYFYETDEAFPTSHKRTAIKTTVELEISPLQVALESLKEKNQELENITLEYEARGPGGQINPLTMVLNGMIEAAVMGGVSNYKEAFLTPEYLAANPNAKDTIEALKDTMAEQRIKLQRALALHGRICGPELQPLQMQLELTMSSVDGEGAKASPSPSPTPSQSTTTSPSPSPVMVNTAQSAGSPKSATPLPRANTNPVLMTRSDSSPTPRAGWGIASRPGATARQYIGTRNSAITPSSTAQSASPIVMITQPQSDEERRLRALLDEKAISLAEYEHRIRQGRAGASSPPPAQPTSPTPSQQPLPSQQPNQTNQAAPHSNTPEPRPTSPPTSTQSGTTQPGSAPVSLDRHMSELMHQYDSSDTTSPSNSNPYLAGQPKGFVAGPQIYASLPRFGDGPPPQQSKHVPSFTPNNPQTIPQFSPNSSPQPKQAVKTAQPLPQFSPDPTPQPKQAVKTAAVSQSPATPASQNSSQANQYTTIPYLPPPQDSQRPITKLPPAPQKQAPGASHPVQAQPTPSQASQYAAFGDIFNHPNFAPKQAAKSPTKAPTTNNFS